MSFLQSISPEQAEGEARELYQADEKKKGYISNYTRLFSLRPEVLTAWRNLQASIRRNMRLRRYELATLAAAIEMKCTYWAMAHGAVLRKNFFTEEELTAIVEDFTQAGLPEEEVAVMSLAQKVVRSAHKVSIEDINSLRAYGLKDEEIFDVILAAAARCFFGHSLDAAGLEPDETYLNDLDGELHKVLAVGRLWRPETKDSK